MTFDDNDAQLYNDRGVVYDSLGFHKEALKDYDKAIELNPELAPAYCNKGILYCVLGKFKKAVKLLTKAIELQENFFPGNS